MPTYADDLDHPVALEAPARRVVSLVPSLTETLAGIRPEALVGATEWCTHPADLAATRVRGTKNPDLAAIRALAPDLVVANQEENRELDVRRLRESGVAVWVTRIETVPEALSSIGRLLAAMGWETPDWLGEAERLWAEPLPARARVSVPIWRDPWMVVGGRTFTADLLRRVGLPLMDATDSAETAARYPAREIAAIDDAGADLVLLPDEPYVFTADDGPEAFVHTPTALVSGRLLTWYGPSMIEAHRTFSALNPPGPPDPPR